MKTIVAVMNTTQAVVKIGPDPCCRSVTKEFACAFSCRSIELWMHLGSLESTHSCSPNFSHASITRYTHAKHEQILNFMVGMWSYLRASRKYRHFLLSLEILWKKPPFLDISALLSLTPGSESRHFEIFSVSPLSQVQTLPFFSKPMCHALAFQVPRFWISRLINCHSPSVSMETK